MTQLAKFLDQQLFNVIHGQFPHSEGVENKLPPIEHQFYLTYSSSAQIGLWITVTL